MKREEISIEEQKRLKMLAVKQATVTAVVKSTLKGTGIGLKVGINFDAERHTLSDWEIKK